MNFIQLTRHNGSKAWVNFSLVTEFGPREGDKEANSWVTFVSNDTEFFKETPEQITTLIPEST